MSPHSFKTLQEQISGSNQSAAFVLILQKNCIALLFCLRVLQGVHALPKSPLLHYRQRLLDSQCRVAQKTEATFGSFVHRCISPRWRLQCLYFFKYAHTVSLDRFRYL